MIARNREGLERGAAPPDGVRSFRRRLWRYGPVILWVGFIFFASSASFSASNTSRVIRPLLLWLYPGMSEEALSRAHLLTRKCAHFAEYAVLALLAARAFLSSARTPLRRHWAAAALALVAVCSLLDEYHQSFLPSRTGSFYDSMIDAAGGAFALVLIALRRKRAGENVTGRE